MVAFSASKAHSGPNRTAVQALLRRRCRDGCWRTDWCSKGSHYSRYILCISPGQVVCFELWIIVKLCRVKCFARSVCIISILFCHRIWIWNNSQQWNSKNSHRIGKCILVICLFHMLNCISQNVIACYGVKRQRMLITYMLLYCDHYC